MHRETISRGEASSPYETSSRRTLSFFLILLFFFSGLSLFAQENDGEDIPDNGSIWIDIESEPYSPGDTNFVLTLGVLVPVYFSAIDDNSHGLSVGGTGSLAFNYFITSGLFVGGELSGMFSSSRRGNMLYIIPFGVRAGYQFLFGRFEFPVSLFAGAASQSYIEKNYFGIMLKPGASVFWRFNADWSFGLNAAWWFVPQWPKNGYDVIGNFMELTLSARYNF
jgi:hypothetical protein